MRELASRIVREIRNRPPDRMEVIDLYDDVYSCVQARGLFTRKLGQKYGNAMASAKGRIRVKKDGKPHELAVSIVTDKYDHYHNRAVNQGTPITVTVVDDVDSFRFRVNGKSEGSGFVDEATGEVLPLSRSSYRSLRVISRSIREQFRSVA